MKILKRLQVFTLCFCLYHLQINAGLDVTISAANANVVADQVKSSADEAVRTYKGSETGNGIDEEGNRTATTSVKTDGDNLLTTADYIALLTMLALGVVASSLLKAKPKTMDIMVGAAAGVAYIGSEILAVVEHGKKDVDQQISLTLYSNGQMDHEQIKTLEKQKQDYKNIEDTAKIKMMLQMAAAAGFTAAAGIALYRSFKNETVRNTCSAALTTGINGAFTCSTLARKQCLAGGCSAMLTGVAACVEACAKPLELNCSACAKSLGVAQERLAEIQGLTVSPGESIIQHAKFKELYTGLQTSIQNPVCAHPYSQPPMQAPALKPCLATQEEIVTDITSTGEDISFDEVTGHLPYSSEDGLESLVFGNPALMVSVLNMADEMKSELEVDLNEDVNSLLTHYFEKQQRRFGHKIDISKFSDDQINGYIAARDYDRYLAGEVSSATLEDYDNFSRAFRPQSSLVDNYSLTQVLTTALNTGIDLLVPRVFADTNETTQPNSSLNIFANSGKGGGGLATKLGLGAAAVGVFIGMRTGAHKTINKFLAAPHRRAIVWAAMALFAGSAAAVSNKIAGKMGDNANKIDTLIGKMRNLENSNIDSISTKPQDIYKVGTFPITGNTPINVSQTGTEVIPCVNGGKSPCNSISGDLEKSTGFIEMNTGFASAAKLATALADGVQGQSTLSGATLDNAGKLANSLGALKKRNRSLQDQINKLRLKQGQRGIDLDANAKRMADALANNTRRNLASANGRDLLASYGAGYGGIGNDLQSELANVPPAEEEEQMTETIFTNPTGGTGGVANTGGSGGDDFNWGLFGADTSSSGIAGFEGNPETSNLDEFEEATDDIVGNKDVTIWKVISTRYLKSGYSRLLDEIK